MDTRRVIASVLVAGSLLAGGVALPATPAAAVTGSYGGADGTDPYYPRQGNGGYDVVDYSLHISYAPSTKRLGGVVGVRATARIALSKFDLDLRRNLVVSSVSVDGRRAWFSQPAGLVQELVIAPAQVIPAGHQFVIWIGYAGTARSITDPGGGIDGIVPTSDGAVVVSEPQGSPTWFPVNDTPTDKALYTIAITIPQNLDAVSNGQYLGRSIANGQVTSRWRMGTPVSSYLITMAVGHWSFTHGTTPGGIPYLNAADPAQAGAAAMLRRIPGIVDWYARLFGRFPFGQTGGIVENAPFLGYSLETASRPVYDKTPSLLTLSHEQAHQWFGDSVSVARWRDIWLNEGFAEFASWLWDEHVGRESATQHMRDVLSVPASSTWYWNPPPGNPGSAANVFAGSVYQRGAATLQALRIKLGSTLFFSILRGWLAAHRTGNARVDQFTAYAEARAHRDLTPFFYEWLYRSGKPRV